MSKRIRAAGVAPGEEGSLIILVMMFVLVFLGMSVALLFLVMNTTSGTELERKEVKAFNVAEAGIDAGMLALMYHWPDSAANPTTVDETAMRADFDAQQFRDPARSPADEFIQVAIYDNSAGSPDYDANGDGKMYVDSEANVDDDRHRIIILAERKTWQLNFPLVALYANVVGSNGKGLEVRVDPAQTEPLPGGTYVAAYYNGETGKGIDLPADGSVAPNPDSSKTFDELVNSGLMGALKSIATSENTYFTNASAAQTFLLSADAPGSIIYLETTSAVEIAGNTQIGTPENPVVLVIDANGSDVGLDFRGTADFYGIVVIKGNPIIRGTSSFYGSFLASGAIDNKGNGSVPEIRYNGNIIKTINRAYTMSVNIVPNTWEEYTVPDTTTTTVP
ncbi:MAG: hypothetical protein M5U22_02765 [Thermoleophilia bacterium]|nr:hypothetical protein [Thermoleophilia bacterium]